MDIQEDSENFNDFINEVSEPKEEKINISIDGLDDLKEPESEQLCCPYCSFIPRSHAKNKQKSILNHIKKKHPERLQEYLSNNAIPAEVKKEKKQKISEVIESIDESSIYIGTEDDQKLALVSDLDILQAKFPTLWKCPAYSYPESSIEHLKRIKSTYTKLITDKLTNKLALSTIVGLAKMGERVSESLNICNLDGYAYNIQQNEEELLSIIDELIQSQALDMSLITPDIKLGICLLNIGIRTAEQNKVESNLNAQS